jgi:hypothetical protein
MLTPAGEDLLAQLTICAERHDRHLDQIVGPRDRARFLQILKKLTAALTGNGNGHSR